MREFSSLTQFVSFAEKLRVQERAADIEARGAVANELTVEIQRRFGKPWPGVWKELAESTKRVHRLHGVLGGARDGDTPLLVTGKLRQSISWAHTGSRETGIGSDSPYAVYHELGGRVRGRPPQRSFMVASARYMNIRLFSTFCRVYRTRLGL